MRSCGEIKVTAVERQGYEEPNRQIWKYRSQMNFIFVYVRFIWLSNGRAVSMILTLEFLMCCAQSFTDANILSYVHKIDTKYN